MQPSSRSARSRVGMMTLTGGAGSGIGKRIRAAEDVEDRPPVGRQVIDIVLPNNEIRIPAWLEEWIGPLPGIVDLVLIGINDVRIRFAQHRHREFVERPLGQQVVMVNKRDEVAAGEGKSRVGSCRDVAVDRPAHDLDPRIPLRGLGQYVRDLPVGGRIVGDAQLPVRV
jgi:hypothetical protein